MTSPASHVFASCELIKMPATCGSEVRLGVPRRASYVCWINKLFASICFNIRTYEVCWGIPGGGGGGGLDM